MLPILTLAAAITFGTPHRVAPLNIGVAPVMDTNVAGVAAEGDGFRVYWRQRQSYDEWQLASAHVGHSGDFGVPAVVLDSLSDVSVAGSSDGPVVVWRSADQVAVAVDDGTRPLEPVATVHVFYPAPPAVSCTGHQCAVATAGQVLLIDAARRSVIRQSELHGEQPYAVVLDPDGFAVLEAPSGPAYSAMTRYDASGNLLWFLPFDGVVAVDFDGVRYNAAWILGKSVFVAAIRPDGTLGPARTVYSGAPSQQSSAIAFQCNGPQHLLAFSAAAGPDSPGTNVLALRLDRDLAPVDSAPVAIGITPTVNTAPRIDSNGMLWTVVWNHSPLLNYYTAPEVALVAADRTIVTYQQAPLSQEFSALATTGDQRLVIWGESDRTAFGHLLFTLLNRDGVPLQEPQVLETAPGTRAWAAPFESDFVAAWSRSTPNKPAVAAIIHSCGGVTPVALGNDDRVLAVASNGISAIVVSATLNETHVWRISRTGQLLTPVAIVLENDQHQTDSAVATTDGERFLVAWASETTDRRPHHVALLAPDGTPIVNAVMEDGSDNSNLAAAWNGREYVVISVGDTARATRISRDGATIASSEIGGSTYGSSVVPSLGGWLVAFWRYPGSNYAVRLDAESLSVGPAVMLEENRFRNWEAAADGTIVSVWDEDVEGTNALVLRNVTDGAAPPRRRSAPR